MISSKKGLWKYLGVNIPGKLFAYHIPNLLWTFLNVVKYTQHKIYHFRGCISVTWLHPQCWATITSVHSRPCLSPQKNPIHSHASLSPPPPPPAVLCLCIYLFYLFHTQYLGSCDMCVTCLTSFTRHVSQVPPCCSMYQNFIPFYGWIILHSMDIPHFVFHLSFNGHLGHFPCLAIVNNAAMNIFYTSAGFCGNYVFKLLWNHKKLQHFTLLWSFAKWIRNFF